MPESRVEVSLNAPPALAFGALREIVSAIAAQEAAWEGFALHVDLGDARLPDVGYIAIPVILTAKPVQPGIQQIDIAFRAARHPESFPTFDGAIGVDSTGPSGAMLWLSGEYSVPLAAAGKLFDATVLRGVAERALQNLVDDIATACRARIDKNEAAYARYRLFDRP